jgi:hypothetical protein
MWSKISCTAHLDMDSGHSVWREKMVNVEVTASLHGWGHEHWMERNREGQHACCGSHCYSVPLRVEYQCTPSGLHVDILLKLEVILCSNTVRVFFF